MSYDPNFPPTNAKLESLPFRNQFQGLKTLIDAVPGVTDVIIDGVTTLPPGAAATVEAVMIGTVLHLTLGIPQGSEGPQGNPGTDGGQGSQGIPGNDGMTGAPGPPFATAIIDAVNTLSPGSAVTVSATFDGTNVHFTFGIPAGFNGTDGTNGTNGTNGEVSTADLTNAINGTSANSNGVATLDTPFANDPPTLADMETMRAKINEFILAARR